VYPTPQELEAAQAKLRDLFFALAFDPDSAEAEARADEALRELDELYAAAGAPKLEARS
jgi:hypothetical protein